MIMGSCYRSEGFTRPPGQGVAVREFNERLESLQKENFGLKLRIYILEETSMNQKKQSEISIDLLRKELEKYRELMKEAAQAMDQMEKMHMQTEPKSQPAADELEQTFKQFGLNTSIEIPKNFIALEKIRELERKNYDLVFERDRLERVLMERDEMMGKYKKMIDDFAFQNSKFSEALKGKDDEIRSAKISIDLLRKELEKNRELLKEAAQAMNQMDQVRTQTQSKNQAAVDDELTRKLKKFGLNTYVEIPDNFIALEKIRELEAKSYDLVFERDKLENVFKQREEMIGKYEKTIDDFAFQNSKFSEALKCKEVEIRSAKGTIKKLRSMYDKMKNSNRQLSQDNIFLASDLQAISNDCRKGVSNTKQCQKQIRGLENVVSRMEVQRVYWFNHEPYVSSRQASAIMYSDEIHQLKSSS